MKKTGLNKIMATFCVIKFAVFLLVGQLMLRTTTAAFVETVTVTIKNGNENIVLNWKQTGKYLANNNLPIWSTRRNKDPKLIRGLMESLGPFAMYHDVEKSSAVVYFERSNCFFGIIDTRFYIEHLPLTEITPDKHHEVNGLYVKARNQQDSKSFHDDFPTPSTSSSIPGMDLNYIHSLFDHILTSNVQPPSQIGLPEQHHEEDETLFAEVLVFITYDRVQSYSTEERDLRLLIADYLVHFNAVDMLYAKLASSGVKIHINIAGLVFEDEPNAFTFLELVPSKEVQSKYTMSPEGTLNAFQIYLRQNKHIFVEDSYDFFFLSTDYALLRGDDQVAGVALSKLNIYEDRLDGFHDPLGLIVEHQPFYANFIASAHELAHVMDVEHDSPHGGRKCNGVQCFAILQPYGSYCKNCLIWSEKSRREFQIYVSTNPNHCFLLNLPRSLHPFGTILIAISPHRQCTCYGYHSHLSTPDYLDAVGLDQCRTELMCTLNARPVNLPTPQPVDGTPCDINKVCWQKQCRVLPQSSVEDKNSYLTFKHTCELLGIGKK